MEDPVPHHPAPLRPGDFAAAIGWWREAGVDLDFADEPATWLADPAGAKPAPAAARPLAPPPSPAAPAAPPFGGDRAAWPTTLVEFQAWWLSEPSLDEGPLRSRVGPRGEAGAPVMVIVPHPEAEDSDNLLSGPEGRLLEAMLAAMGIDSTAVYRAAVLPRHTPLVDWAALGGNGAAALLAHHVGLVAPQRIIAFGTGILPLLGHDPTQNAQISPGFNHEGKTIPLLPARELGALLARPAWKAGFWRQWLDWTGTA